MKRLVEVRFERTGNGYFLQTTLGDQAIREVFETIEPPLAQYDDREWLENGLIDVIEESGLATFVPLDEAESNEQYDQHCVTVSR